MSSPHSFNPTILREYDIRGVVDDTLSRDDAYAVGRAFGTCVVEAGGDQAALGFDGRLTSPGLAEAVLEGLMACGLHVKRINMGPTPMLSFAIRHLDTGSGIMVTGSHNPSDYNGFKMTLASKPFFGDAIQRLGSIAESASYASGEGSVEDFDIRSDYVDVLAREHQPLRMARIAWDPGNGAAGEVLNMLCTRMPGHHHVVNGIVDGTFPGHHPDPTVAENLVDLQNHIAEHDCELGIAFDGDGDRVGVVDGKGRILWADQLMMLFAEDVLREDPGATIIADVKSSQVLFDEIARLGGVPIMWKTGHSLIKSKMSETGSPLAGEMSGHIFFADRYFGFDDGLYAAVRLLALLERQQITLAELRDRIPEVENTPELRFPCAEERKFDVIEEVSARLDSAGADVTSIDGVRVNTEDGWWLLRASNTQDVLVARCEARDIDGLTRLKSALTAQLAESGIAAPEDL
ncbi:MAG: phosphomannomutase/phosphoglucomutase [Alphaproteobacteria bacterium]|jgi:phosphomannomutase|nr:phosphomannomutase/phosphoglucomutase [Alphaproteobacteria bacterium]